MTPETRRAWTALVSIASLGPALCACRSPTQISVDVQTVGVPCSQVTVTSFTSGELGAIESAPPTTESTACDDGHLGTVVLVPSGSDDAQVGFKVVTALNGDTVDYCSGAAAAAASDRNCIVSRRALRYLPHTPLKVVIDMTQACEGQLCDAESTCVNGTCVNATIPDPSQCEGSQGCNETVLGGETGDGGEDASVFDATLSDAPSADGTSDAAAEDAGKEASPGIDASLFQDAAPCDLGGVQAGSPWPMDGFCPNRRARSPLVGPATAEYKWQLTLQSGFTFGGASIGADGTIYLGTIGFLEDGGLGHGVIEAVAPDGGELWAYAPDGGSSFEQTPVLAADSTVRAWEYDFGNYDVITLSGATTSTPSIQSRGGITLVTGGTMYAPDNQGTLWAFAGDGTQLWSAPGTIYDYTVPSVGADGTIYVDDLTSILTAIHPDGGGYWSKPLDAGSGLSSVVVAPDGTLRVFGVDGYLYALDSKTGAENWRTYVDDTGIGGMAIWDDGTTYLGTHTHIVRVDIAGNPGNLAVSGGTYIPIVDANGNVYSVCNNGASLCAFDHALTQTVWEKTPAPGIVGPTAGSPVIGPGGMVYFMAGATYGAGVVYAFGPP